MKNKPAPAAKAPSSSPPGDCTMLGPSTRSLAGSGGIDKAGNGGSDKTIIGKSDNGGKGSYPKPPPSTATTSVKLAPSNTTAPEPTQPPNESKQSDPSPPGDSLPASTKPPNQLVKATKSPNEINDLVNTSPADASSKGDNRPFVEDDNVDKDETTPTAVNFPPDPFSIDGSMGGVAASAASYKIAKVGDKISSPPESSFEGSVGKLQLKAPPPVSSTSKDVPSHAKKPVPARGGNISNKLSPVLPKGISTAGASARSSRGGSGSNKAFLSLQKGISTTGASAHFSRGGNGSSKVFVPRVKSLPVTFKNDSMFSNSVVFSQVPDSHSIGVLQNVEVQHATSMVREFGIGTKFSAHLLKANGTFSAPLYTVDGKKKLEFTVHSGVEHQVFSVCFGMAPLESIKFPQFVTFMNRTPYTVSVGYYHYGRLEKWEEHGGVLPKFIVENLEPGTSAVGPALVDKDKPFLSYKVTPDEPNEPLCYMVAAKDNLNYRYISYILNPPTVGDPGSATAPHTMASTHKTPSEKQKKRAHDASHTGQTPPLKRSTAVLSKLDNGSLAETPQAHSTSPCSRDSSGTGKDLAEAKSPAQEQSEEENDTNWLPFEGGDLSVFDGGNGDAHPVPRDDDSGKSDTGFTSALPKPPKKLPTSDTLGDDPNIEPANSSPIPFESRKTHKCPKCETIKPTGCFSSGALHKLREGEEKRWKNPHPKAKCKDCTKAAQLEKEALEAKAKSEKRSNKHKKKSKKKNKEQQAETVAETPVDASVTKVTPNPVDSDDWKLHVLRHGLVSRKLEMKKQARDILKPAEVKMLRNIRAAFRNKKNREEYLSDSQAVTFKHLHLNAFAPCLTRRMQRSGVAETPWEVEYYGTLYSDGKFDVVTFFATEAEIHDMLTKVGRNMVKSCEEDGHEGWINLCELGFFKSFYASYRTYIAMNTTPEGNLLLLTKVLFCGDVWADVGGIEAYFDEVDRDPHCRQRYDPRSRQLMVDHYNSKDHKNVNIPGGNISPQHNGTEEAPRPNQYFLDENGNHVPLRYVQGGNEHTCFVVTACSSLSYSMNLSKEKSDQLKKKLDKLELKTASILEDEMRDTIGHELKVKVEPYQSRNALKSEAFDPLKSNTQFLVLVKILGLGCIHWMAFFKGMYWEPTEPFAQRITVPNLRESLGVYKKENIMCADIVWTEQQKRDHLSGHTAERTTFTTNSWFCRNCKEAKTKQEFSRAQQQKRRDNPQAELMCSQCANKIENDKVCRPCSVPGCNNSKKGDYSKEQWKKHESIRKCKVHRK